MMLVALFPPLLDGRKCQAQVKTQLLEQENPENIQRKLCARTASEICQKAQICQLGVQ